MKWPFKKKEEESQKEEPVEVTYEDEKERSRFSRLAADVEKLKALITSLEEKGRIDSEKFSRINEQIGELRSSSVEKEKQIKDLEIAATKAVDLVKEVQPEKFMIELKKEDAKLNRLNAQMERYEDTISQVMAEIKEIRTKIELFRGYEELLKLNEETKQELRGIKKMEIAMDIHTNKIERLFIDFQKKYIEFETFKEMGEYLENAYREVIKEINGLKIKTMSFVEKKQIIGLEKSVMEKIIRIDEFMKSKNLTSSTTDEIIQRIKFYEEELNKIKEVLAEYQESNEELYKYLRSLFSRRE